MLNLGGYTVWSVRRTITEAENVARWNPWVAHEWFDEARGRLDIYDAPFHEDYDRAVKRVNYYWRSLRRMRYYDEREFWKKGKVSYPPKFLEPLFDEE